MGFQGVIATVDELKTKGLIKDYAIAGGWAIAYYLEPAYTYDVDVLILVDSGEDHHKVYQYLEGKGNKIENVYVHTDGMAVQLFPAYGDDLYEGAIRSANTVTIGDVSSKVVNKEYLIALLLQGNRAKDKIRIVELLPSVNGKTLNEILRKYDNAKDNLQIKYGRLLKEL